MATFWSEMTFLTFFLSKNGAIFSFFVVDRDIDHSSFSARRDLSFAPIFVRKITQKNFFACGAKKLMY